jgi:hypothetical protein
MPTSGGRDLKKRLVFPAAGLVVGIALSAVLLFLLVVGDRSVRGEADLLPPQRVLGVLPSMRVKRKVARAFRRDAARRAIAYPAGAALPAPGGAK